MKWLGGLLLTVVLPLLLSEFTDWCPWFARRLVRRAARHLPEGSRARWAEEWLADLAALEGRRLSMLMRALWIYLRAPSWGRMLYGFPPVTHTLLGRVRSILLLILKRQPEGSVAVKAGRATVHISYTGTGKPNVLTLDALTHAAMVQGWTVQERGLGLATGKYGGLRLVIGTADGGRYCVDGRAEGVVSMVHYLRHVCDTGEDFSIS